MKKKLIVGNWKMNPTTLDETKRIFKSIKNVSNKLSSSTSIVACPPYVYIPALLKMVGEYPISIGAQDVYFEEQGAFTGQISALMLKDLGASYVIIGHSECRARGDTDENISKKAFVSLEAGLNVILCVGEKARDDQGGHLETLKIQIKDSLSKVQKKHISKLIIAYEPVWAIGAKEPMSPPLIHEMSLFIKKILADMYGHDEAVSTTILYGGSVNFRNAGDIIVQGEVDGLLVGRESVNSTGFAELLKAVDVL